MSTSMVVRTTDGEVPQVLVDVVFIKSRFDDSRDIRHIVIRPTTNPSSVPIDRTPAYKPPRAEGISLRGENVFVHGRLVQPETRPCFLVYDPHKRDVVEFAFDRKYGSYNGSGSIVSIPEWSNQVLPYLKSQTSPSKAKEKTATSVTP